MVVLHGLGVTISCIHVLAGEAAGRAGIDGARRRSCASLAAAFFKERP